MDKNEFIEKVLLEEVTDNLTIVRMALKYLKVKSGINDIRYQLFDKASVFWCMCISDNEAAPDIKYPHSKTALIFANKEGYITLESFLTTCAKQILSDIDYEWEHLLNYVISQDVDFHLSIYETDGILSVEQIQELSNANALIKEKVKEGKSDDGNA